MQFTFPRLAIAMLFICLIWVSGFLIGQWVQADDVAASRGPQYALLVHDDSIYPGDPRDQATAYANWMIGLQASGRFAAGEELQNGGQVLKMIDDEIDVTGFQEQGAYGEISGFFLIQAENDAEAIKIASECPHLKYNGTIEVRKIVER